MITTDKVLGISPASRKTRRWIVCGYLCVVALTCFGFLHHQARHGIEDMGLWNLFLIFVNVSAFLGGIRMGGLVKPFRRASFVPMQADGDVPSILPSPRSSRTESTSLDERETLERDHIHFIAYTAARWLALLLLVLYALLGAFHVPWFSQVGPFFLFLLTLTLWSLPQTLILWTEPDMVDE